jgi:hypothetical protein
LSRRDISAARNADTRASLAALRRAAGAARRTAIDTGTEIVIVRDGMPVRIPAAQLLKERPKTGETPSTTPKVGDQN